MSNYRNNHYVPVWYQKRFIIPGSKEKKLYYLDLKPGKIKSGHKIFVRNSLMHWGPKSCFCEIDLYTTKGKGWISTEIEEKFFGPVDASARSSMDYFSDFTHPSADGEELQNLIKYLSIQKLRTPKGMAFLSRIVNSKNKNHILLQLQRLRNIYCAIWTECIWCVLDSSQSDTKFIISDHPVTVYNQGCFPASRWCKGPLDPDIWMTGTHTLFPLSPDKILVLTNLSWARYPYGNPRKDRPHPELFRDAMFNFQSIQVGRLLSENEVIKINYIIKNRAYRYIASGNKDWLYPEKQLGRVSWDTFGREYLLMPDPRSMGFTGGIVIGFSGGGGDAFDPYGRRPWQDGYEGDKHNEREWETFHAFQGEYARLFGPRRRGQSFDLSRLSPDVDSEDYHNYHLNLERNHKKHRWNGR